MVIQKLLVILWSSILATATKDNIICPDGKSMCSDSETCCQMKSGDYGCCPLPNAVCCTDNVHCCPSGYTCNLETVSCDRQGHKMPLFDQISAKPVSHQINKGNLVQVLSLKRVMCPDHSSYCQDGNTCCKTETGTYACCPLPFAVCCPDHIHCCPNGYSCSQGFCQKGNNFVLMKRKINAIKAFKEKTESCDHGHGHCQPDDTCCPMKEGEFGCCPMKDAVCCPDKEHCCPLGFKCNDFESRCTANGISIPYLPKIKPKKTSTIIKLHILTEHSLNEANTVFCPDHITQCPENFSCCKDIFGLWECCPFPNATCCKDHRHCCPYGTVCHISNMTCIKKDSGLSIPWVSKKRAKRPVPYTTTCPDMTTCPTGYTCCLLSTGMYGCCPYPNAVCCSDKSHCCPQGTTCDIAHGVCLQENIASLQQLTLNKFLIDMKPDTHKICPDHKSFCHAGSTCCQLSGGTYGCCPYKDAVCCEDREHCCPHGMTCDTQRGRCLKKYVVALTKKKLPSFRKSVPSQVSCKDGSSCPSGYTCCKLSTGGYGCCPYEEAVCCSDGKHCCPHGTTCNVAAGTCDGGMKSMAISEITKSVKDVSCPDGSSCPSGYTCCKLSTGGYGCCPYEEAVCCSDGKHCCPHGTTCNVAAGTCDGGMKSMAISEITKSVKDVSCPDGSSCPSGYTCCKFSTGGYGCCPYEEAVCCSDGKHCCPHGTTCNVAAGTCDGGMKSMAISEITKSVKDVSCPDGSSCPSGYTCCKLSTGGYGCCPYEEAVCCSDGKHCCPHGTTCNVAAGTCDGGMKSMAISEITKSVKDVSCPDGSSCPSGYTCCKLSTGGYGCCPYEEAVCCSDGKHCCPHGTTCNVAAGTCDGGMKSMVISEITKSVKDVSCPDGSSCPSGYTCCKLSTGGYGCCPYEEAVCCSDGKHCCPHGTTCNVAAGTCDGGMKSMAISEITKSVKDVSCPDGSSCPSGYTCCKLSTGGYGCCPYEEAVCCSDGKHCCPHGTTCNVAAGTCDGGMKSMAISEITKSVKDVSCPDGSSCPSGYTCCKLSTGGYGCCPYEEAVCCSDGKHCCPHGTTCNVAAGTCDGGMKSMAISEITKSVKDVSCPDGSSCPSGYTCCKLSTGGYGCCPYEEAVCCSDGKHCCPHGTTCNAAAGTCDGGMKSMAISEITKSVKDVSCPDGSSCPSGYTCCKLSTGGYGCCPYEEAVCCSDGKHCCPHGTTCNVAAGTCDGGMKSMAISEITKSVKDVSCPDGSSCPSGYTCCKLSTGGYGCCPYEEAVCCSDGKHCCPHGTTCNVAAGTCDGGMKSMAISEITKSVKDVSCPDGSSCPSGYTCCKLSTGGYGCCPYEEAVCCSDGKHCCPHGTTCNVAAGTCDGGMKSMAISEITKSVKDVSCPDGSSCPSGYTCCKLSTGGYGCCPYEEAVCCSDGKHCCPHGTTCNVAAGTCDGGMKSMAISEITKSVKDVSCPDGSSCPSGYTCCKLSTGGYGCCPYEEAVCCSDGKHCCPHGTTCNVAAGTCDGGMKSIAVSTVFKSVRFSLPLSLGYGDVVCPDGLSSCPDGYTCCKLSSGEYGCCPFLSAVCCSDGQHCCPKGTRCDLSTQTCIGKDLVVKMKKKVKAVNTENTALMRCPDELSSCPWGFSCCKLSSGDYGCCPYHNAVCCEDKEHCCPHGMSCDLKSGHCISRNNIAPLQTNVAAASVRSVICPDGKHKCPDGYTCCVIGDDKYGCCPYQHAVCCSDKKHCCPSGFTCGAQGR